jgi:hypothetical protein
MNIYIHTPSHTLCVYVLDICQVVAQQGFRTHSENLNVEYSLLVFLFVLGFVYFALYTYIPLYILHCILTSLCIFCSVYLQPTRILRGKHVYIYVLCKYITYYYSIGAGLLCFFHVYLLRVCKVTWTPLRTRVSMVCVCLMYQWCVYV